MSKKIAFMLLLVGAASASYASSSHSSSIDTRDELHAGAVSIPPGHYTLQWAGDTGDTDLKVIGSKKKEYTIPVTVKSGQAVSAPQMLTHQDGGATTLDGFKLKDLVLTVR